MGAVIRAFNRESTGSARLVFICGAITTSLIFSLASYLNSRPILPEGPAVAISEVTKSLWETGSLTPQYFLDTRAEAAAYSKATSSDLWQDVFALDKFGNLRPKHSLFSCFTAVPFYALFGENGFWLMQQLFFLWLLSSTYLIVESLGAKRSPWTTLVTTCLLSQTLFYSYEFSYDLHGCALIMGGLCLMAKRPLAGGAVMALSVYVRPTHVLLVLPLLFAQRGSNGPAATRDALFGAMLAALPFLWLNYFFWGNPLLTAYARLPGFHNGEMVLSPHPAGLDLEILAGSWGAKLFSAQGILPFNLAFLALPAVIPAIRNHPERRFLFVCLAAALSYSIYIFSYPMWSATFYGNRFLMPAIYLYLIPFIVAASRLELKFRSRSTV